MMPAASRRKNRRQLEQMRDRDGEQHEAEQRDERMLVLHVQATIKKVQVRASRNASTSEPTSR